MTNRLPMGWCECKLEDFVQILDSERKPINSDERDKRLKKAEGKTLYPYYGATGQIGYIDDYLIDGEFVLLGEDGAPFLDSFKNKAYIVNGKFWVNNHAHILKGFDNITCQFICYWLNSISYRTYVSGTTRLKLNQAKMKEIVCNLPPIAEQKRIVEKIEEMFEKIDIGIEKLKLLQEKIKKYKQSILHSAFTGKLCKTSEWKERVFSEIISINPKTDIPELPDKELVSFLPMPAVIPEVNFYNKELVTYSKVKKGYTKFQNNDVLFAKITPCMENGKICIVNNLKHSFGFGSTEFHILRSLGEIIPIFIFYFVVQESFRKTAQNFMTGAVGQRRVPTEYLKQIKINLPSLKEQHKIVEEIEKRFAKADKLLDIVEESLKSADELKQSILKQAFEGRLVPQDPNDEPASILLDRIKAEKQQNKMKKGKRKDGK